MQLLDLIDNVLTDKHTGHSYLPIYQTFFNRIKDSATDILEVGIGDFNEKNGGSIKLWLDYFSNAKVYGIDILSEDRVLDELKVNPRTVLYTSTNAYDPIFVEKEFGNKKFDILIDDGPHTLESMISFITLYAPLLKDDGVLIVEDLPFIEWTRNLTDATPLELKNFIEIYDLRKNKGRRDDILFIINKKR
jgi:hypothetical protein